MRREYSDFMVKKETCPKCGKEFECVYEEQQPGFRFPEDMICPYCKEILKTSLEYDFITRKL